MGKNFFKGIIVLACFLLCTLAFCGCSVLGEIHIVHDFGEWETVIEPTCTESGKQESKCSGCDKIKTQVIDALGHDCEQWTVTLEATCATDGSKTATCTRCGEIVVQTIAALGHDTVYHEGKEATATENGWKEYYTCSRCDYTTYEVIPALNHEHDYQPIVTPPTCTEDGYTIYTCKGCGDSYKADVVTASGHTFGEWTVTSEATCTKDGSKTRVCSSCSFPETDKIVALGHDLIYHDAKTPTTTENGWDEYYTCSRCDYTTLVMIPPLEHTHSFSGSSVCTTCKIEVGYDKYNNRYGYNAFTGNKKKFYMALSDAAMNFHDHGGDVAKDSSGYYVVFSVSYSMYGLTLKDAEVVYKIFSGENPLYYWLDNSYLYNDGTKKFYVLTTADYAAKSSRDYYNKLVKTKTEEYLNMIDDGDGAYRICLAYHDAILTAIDYARDGSGNPQGELWAHSVIGVFEERGAVCEGYAKTFAMLLNMSDVENIYVTGEAGERHAWNLVRLDDGFWYWCDITWDDQPGEEFGYVYYYFCVNDTQITFIGDKNLIVTSPKNFLQSHAVDTTAASGSYYLYDLPARAVDEYDGQDKIRSIFEVGDAKYAVAAFNSVQLVAISATGDFSVPEKVTYQGNDYTVISIGSIKDGLYNLEGIDCVATSITIPKTVKVIWRNALKCHTLSAVTVDSENKLFKSVGNIVYDPTMTTVVAVPGGISSVSLASTVTEIGEWAFAYCSRLLKMTVPENVTRIGNYAFYCSGITQITLTKNIIGIGDVAFGSCFRLVEVVNLTSFTVTAGSSDNGYVGMFAKAVYTSVPATEKFTISGDYVFYAAPDGHYHMAAYVGTATELVLPSDFNGGRYIIGNGAFMNCTTLKTVSITDGVNTAVYNYAFYNCKNLESIVLSTKVTWLGYGVFENCDKFSTIYYCGNATQFNEINTSNTSLSGYKVYYYSATKPATSGSYWYYDGGKATAWSYSD